MRKLVSIREISAKYPIEGADLIELVQVDGWQCIAKKGEFEVGTPCVYFEIDSFLPLEERYAFLKKTSKFDGKEGYRIRSMKMRGVISQGLALPLSMFNNIDQDYSVGDDITSQLGVIKYDNAQSKFDQKKGLKSGQPAGKFPSFLRKTDQERIQNLISYFDSLKEEEFEETLKLDGSSLTAFHIPEPLPWYKKLANLIGFNYTHTRFGVCSRNLEIKPSDDYVKTFQNGNKSSTYAQSDFWKAALKYNLPNVLPVGYALQGELIGPKIQSNHEKVDSLEFYVFDIYNIEEERYLTPTERDYMMSGVLQNVPHVPVVNKSIKIFEKYDLQGLLSRVEGQSMNPGTISEGRVYKSVTNPNITFKAISNKYLLKAEK